MESTQPPARRRRRRPSPFRPAVACGLAPWLGYSCLGQCETACAANVYLGPGNFHFAATVLPGGVRVTGPAFTLPPERPGDMMRHILNSTCSQSRP